MLQTMDRIDHPSESGLIKSSVSTRVHRQNVEKRVTPTEPIDSLSMGDEHLNTIPAMESNEFIKSFVENLVPNPSESEGENGCDILACFTTFSNVLFDADYDSDSSDDQSLSVENVREKIYSNPLFDEEIIPMEIDPHSFNAESDLIESLPNHDSSVIISSKIDSLFDEFAGELTLLKSFPPGIDETDCHPKKKIRFAKRLLYDNLSPRPPKEIVSDNSNADIESFSPSPIPNKDSDSHMEEINLYFNTDDPIPPGIEEDGDDSGRDIPILEELLDNYFFSLPATESYHFDIPSPYRPPAKPPDGKIETLNIKMMGDVSDQKVKLSDLKQALRGRHPMLIITPTEPIDSLRLGDEHLDTISTTKSDEFIKSCVKNLVPNPKIVSDNSHADIESFSPSPIPNLDSDPLMEEIDLSFNPDDPMPPVIEDDDYDSGRDILILVELLDNYSLSLPTNESDYFDIPSPYRPPAKPPDGNTGTLNIKMMGDVSDPKVHIPGLSITRVLNQEKSVDLLSHLGLEAF
nr:hypothetical protein [Tanacetum cinerariifolium]